MKKILCLVMLLLCLTGCNYAIFDLHYEFNYAMFTLPNGELIEGNIKSWTDYEGEQLQITMEDGTVYLTNSFNCVLINK